MRLETMLPEGSGNTAFEEAMCHTGVGWTDLLLRHHSSIVRAWNQKRIEQGRDWIAKKFITHDHPEGFFLRVTDRDARYVLATWSNSDAFLAAEVSFCRVDDPFAVATGDA